MFDERLSPLGTLGIALVLAGIVDAAPVPAGGAPGGLAGTALLWPVVNRADDRQLLARRQGRRGRLNPVPYMLLLEGGCALLGPAAAASASAPPCGASSRLAAIVLAAVMSALAYTLVLFAFRLSKTGYVVAARELSIVLSAVIGSLWLREGRLAPRLAGAAIVLAGVACIALAR